MAAYCWLYDKLLLWPESGTTTVDSGAQKRSKPIPHGMLRTTPRGPRAIGPCHCRTTAQRAGELANSDRRPLGRPACVARGDLKSTILQRFPYFCTLRVEIFRMFLSIHVYLWLWWIMKSFMEMGPHFFEKSGRQTHTETDRRGSFIYIYIYIEVCLRNQISAALALTVLRLHSDWTSAVPACELLLLLPNLYSAQIQTCSSQRRWCSWVGKWTSRGG